MTFDTKRVIYHTLGCKLNFTETSHLAKQLSSYGYKKVDENSTDADVIIINTCSVTDVADHKCRQAIAHFHNQCPSAHIIVTGCYAQLKPEEVSAIPGVSLVLGINEKMDADRYVSFIESHDNAKISLTATKDIKAFTPSRSYDDRTRCFLKIQDGCNYFCTYCTIPYARGRSRSSSIADVLTEAHAAIADGAHEIIITGVNTGDFGHYTGESFLDLLQQLDKVDANIRYRISSIEPNLLTDEIISFVSQSSRFMPHFHIPLQSGSDDVLRLMRRRYDRNLFRHKVEFIKSLMPNAFIGVDVIAGMRGETSEFFHDSIEFIDSLDITQLHVFPYSERRGTKALEIPFIVSPEEKKLRCQQLHEVSERKLQDFYSRNIGRTAVVLWENANKSGNMHGFTENYIRVSQPYDPSLVNKFQRVTLSDFSDDRMLSLSVR